MKKVKTITVGIIARNEAEYLPALLNDILAQTYPLKNIELILVDACSSDKTARIMKDFIKVNQAKFLNTKFLTNKKLTQATGWNLVIKNFNADCLARIDAHAHIPDDFIQKNIDNLNSGENISGGVRPCLVKKQNAWSKTLLVAENSLFGSSIAASRSGNKKCYTNSFFHAVYRKEVLKKVGLFNEKLLRTEDNEFHYRMRQAGYKFAMDPNIKSYQYVRSNLRKMIKQKYANGYWIALTLSVCPGCISLYHLAPLAFLLAIVITSILAALGLPIFAILMWTLYALFCILSTVISFNKKDFSPFNILMPFIFLILHLAYGVGSFIGLLAIPFKYKELKQSMAS